MMTFDRFDEIKHLPLQVFNRVVYLTSLKEDGGEVTRNNYLKLFSNGEQQQIAIMAMYIKDKGLDAVRKEVTRGLVIVDDEFELAS